MKKKKNSMGTKLVTRFIWCILFSLLLHFHYILLAMYNCQLSLPCENFISPIKGTSKVLEQLLSKSLYLGRGSWTDQSQVHPKINLASVGELWILSFSLQFFDEDILYATELGMNLGDQICWGGGRRKDL